MLTIRVELAPGCQVGRDVGLLAVFPPQGNADSLSMSLVEGGPAGQRRWRGESGS